MDRYVPEFDEETRLAKYAAWKRAVERAMHWAQDDRAPCPVPGQ
jgi:glycerol kinase